MLSPDLTEAEFSGALWATERSIPRGLVPAARFAIHRTNVYASLTACLRARFPVVARLVGDDFFTRCARVFIKQQPPRSPILMRYGVEFPDFIAVFNPARALPYLASVALLEWRFHVAQHGADAAVLAPSVLAALPAERMDDLVFDLHPTCHILRSPHPVLTIWRTNTYDEVTQTIPADSPGETVLIARPRETVLLLRLDEGADTFIEYLMRGASLGRATAEAQAVGRDFDLAAALAVLFRAAVLTGFHLDPARTGIDHVP